MGRSLPPELVAEIHKCLPLPNAINVLVNVSKTFVINNGPRMLRNVQRLRTSLNEYNHTFETFEDEEGENDPGRLVSNDNVEWTPKLDALLRYGTWLTSARQLEIIDDNIVGRIPINFVEELLLHLANSSQMMLQSVHMRFEKAAIPIPTFLKQFYEKKQYMQIGRRNLFEFESIELKTENGQILRIFDGELRQYYDGNYQLTLIVENKMDGKNWYEISMTTDPSKEFIRRLVYSCWEMQPFHENGEFEFNWLKDFLKQNRMEENGNKLKAMQNILWNYKWDFFLRHGACNSQFRHFKIKKPYNIQTDFDYDNFLISYISNAKHPEQFLESIDINLRNHNRCYYCSPFIDEIWEICQNGIPKGGKFINVDTQKLHFLSAKTVKPKSSTTKTKLQFTLANIPTNGKYLFDVNVQFKNGRSQKVGIKIQKRKVDDIVGLKCNDQIDNREEKMNGNGRTALIKMILTGIGIASILFLTPRFAYF